MEFEFKEVRARDMRPKIGYTISRLKLLSLPYVIAKGEMIDVECSCGTRKTMYWSNVKFGKSQSCGCLARERASAHQLRHGLSKKPGAYKSWYGMKGRCYNKNNPKFPNYGARGIVVCERWRRSFDNFLEDMGHPHPGQSIDRINNDGNYEPGNCRWSYSIQQARNKTTTNYVFVEGVRMSLVEAVEKHSALPYQVVWDRITRYGWSTEDALNKPSRSKKWKSE